MPLKERPRTTDVREDAIGIGIGEATGGDVMSARVLVVDDDPAVVETLRGVLEQRGFTLVGSAAEGDGAATLAGQLHPDVVIMDRMMPGVDGVEATRRIKANAPDTQVIMLSAHVDAEVQREGETLGIYCYLAKGCSENLIADMVGRAAAFKSEMTG